jgi:hypothetical protein
MLAARFTNSHSSLDFWSLSMSGHTRDNTGIFQHGQRKTSASGIFQPSLQEHVIGIEHLSVQLLQHIAKGIFQPCARNSW